MKEVRRKRGTCKPGTPECVCQALAERYENGILKLYRGKVSRTRLEDALGSGRNRFVTAVRKHPDVAPGRCIVRFDDVLERRGHGTVWTEKIPAIRRKLKRLALAGTLPVNEQGDLNRQGLLKDFELGHRMSVYIVQKRAPKLKALLDEYDTTRGDPAYSAYKYDTLSEALKELLEDPALELTHGRVISTLKLTERLGVHPTALSNTPKLQALIDGKQDEIERRLRRGTTVKSFRVRGVEHINLGTTPYSEPHKRVFSFCDLIKSYNLGFAEKVATLFIAIAHARRTAKGPHARIRHFLLWLARTRPGIAEHLRDGETIPKEEFQRASLIYHAEVVSTGRANSSNEGGKYHAGVKIIEQFAAAGLFPRTRFPKIKDTRRKRRNQSARPSLVEAQSETSEEDAIAKLALEEASYRGIDFDSGKDAAAFANTLARERALRTDLPASLPAAIAMLCEERLTEIRKAAAETFEQWREKYLTARKLIREADHTGEHIHAELTRERAQGVHRRKWQDIVSGFFPSKEPKRALANLLALIDHAFDGICPHGTKSEWGTFWMAQYRKLGGVHELQEYLFPPNRVTSAVIFLYLCESGANPEVAMTLEPSAIRPSRRPRTLSIVGHKVRSGGKAIFAELPTKGSIRGATSAAKAMIFYRDAVEHARTNAPNSPLFLRLSRGKLERTAEWQLRADMKPIAQRSRKLAALKLVPSMIRPTVLLRAQLKNPTNPEVVQLLASHNSPTTTMGYVNKLPYRLILEERIRTFSNTLEVIIASDPPHSRSRKSRAQWDEARAQAQRTGLGVWCSNPTAGAQPDFPEGTTCHAVDRCLSCSKLLVAADENSIADMILWRESLDAAEPTWLNERTSRWERVWVPWQAFFQVVLDEKMSRGELAAIKHRGDALAKRRAASESFRAPQPW